VLSVYWEISFRKLISTICISCWIFFFFYVIQCNTWHKVPEHLYPNCGFCNIFLAVWDWNNVIAFASAFTVKHISRNMLYVKVGGCLYLKKEKCISFIKCRHIWTLRSVHFRGNWVYTFSALHIYSLFCDIFTIFLKVLHV
jgi:hypothetical protein